MTAKKLKSRFRSKDTGLWYVTLEAAGTVDAVKIDGVLFTPEEQEDVIEKECPACGALNNVTGMDNYSHLFCHGCNAALELTGDGLVPV